MNKSRKGRLRGRRCPGVHRKLKKRARKRFYLLRSSVVGHKRIEKRGTGGCFGGPRKPNRSVSKNSGDERKEKKGVKKKTGDQRRENDGDKESKSPLWRGA